MVDDPFPYSELRNASHEFFAKVWRAQKSGSVKEFSLEVQRLVQRMASHPEWRRGGSARMISATPR